MTDESAARCAVPDCDKLARKRGLCHMHYFRTGRAKVNDPQRIEALKYMLPSRKGQRPKACPKDAETDGGPDDPDRKPSLWAQKIDKAVRANAKRADIRIGAMTEFADAFHIGRVKDGGGFIFEHPTKDILIRLDDAGNLHEGDFTVKGKIDEATGN